MKRTTALIWAGVLIGYTAIIPGGDWRVTLGYVIVWSMVLLLSLALFKRGVGVELPLFSTLIESVVFAVYLAGLVFGPHSLTIEALRGLISPQLIWYTTGLVGVAVASEVYWTAQSWAEGSPQWKWTPMIWGVNHDALWQVIKWIAQAELILRLSIWSSYPTVSVVPSWSGTIIQQISRNGGSVAALMAAVLPLVVLLETLRILRVTGGAIAGKTCTKIGDILAERILAQAQS